MEKQHIHLHREVYSQIKTKIHDLIAIKMQLDQFELDLAYPDHVLDHIRKNIQLLQARNSNKRHEYRQKIFKNTQQKQIYDLQKSIDHSFDSLRKKIGKLKDLIQILENCPEYEYFQGFSDADNEQAEKNDQSKQLKQFWIKCNNPLYNKYDQLIQIQDQIRYSQNKLNYVNKKPKSILTEQKEINQKVLQKNGKVSFQKIQVSCLYKNSGQKQQQYKNIFKFNIFQNHQNSIKWQIQIKQPQLEEKPQFKKYQSQQYQSQESELNEIYMIDEKNSFSQNNYLIDSYENNKVEEFMKLQEQTVSTESSFHKINLAVSEQDLMIKSQKLQSKSQTETLDFVINSFLYQSLDQKNYKPKSQ